MHYNWRKMRVVIAMALAATFAAAKSYPVDGVVVALDPAARSLLVSHRPIANYMPAMVMPFRVADVREFEGLHPGARIEFNLEVSKQSSLARNIRRASGADVQIAPPKERLRVGDSVPHLGEFRGKVVAVNFIYTRCPLPDVCPRLSANFAAVERRFRGDDLMLLSITVDPDYDTPEVLAEYAKRWGADPGRWRFLPANASLATALGEVYWTDEGSIGHNSVTSIIGRDGRLAAVIEGASYRADQLQNLIEHELKGVP
jgi:protein SCO1